MLIRKGFTITVKPFFCFYNMKYLDTNIAAVYNFVFTPRSDSWAFLSFQDKATKDILTIERDVLNTSVADDGETTVEIAIGFFNGYEDTTFDALATILEEDFSANNVVYHTLIGVYSGEANKQALNASRYTETETPSNTNTDYITL